MPAGGLREWLSPESSRHWPGSRAWNIGFRTAHLLCTGVLLGGHAFDVPAERLYVSLWGAIGTGIGLIVLEAYPGARWLYQGQGLMVLAKLALLSLVPFLWTHRFELLIGVVILASVGSHMPARFRYYSVIHRRVLSKCSTQVSPDPATAPELHV
jgi:hypothetical protein